MRLTNFTDYSLRVLIYLGAHRADARLATIADMRDRALTPVTNANGDDVILAGTRVARFNSEQGLGFDLAYRPGSLKEMLRQMSSGNPAERYEPEPMRPEYLEREPRIAVREAERGAG